MTLEKRREQMDIIEVYKTLKGLTRIDPSQFWEARTRARTVKKKKKVREENML